MSNKRKKVFFIPSIETHYDNFIPICTSKLFNMLDPYLLIIEDVFAANRNVERFVDLENQIFFTTYTESLTYLRHEYSESSQLIVVGNDSEKRIMPLIHKVRSLGYKIVLMQDGWLDHSNLLKPVYSRKGLYFSLKRILHRFLVLNIPFFTKKLSNFIGQNSDYYFVYSEVAKLDFLKAGIPEDRIFITGSPRFDMISSLKEGAINLKNVIVFFLTVYNDEHDNLINDIIVSIKKVSENKFPEYVLLIKTHPRDLKDYNSHVDDSTILYRKSINKLFSEYNVSFAFCFNSTVIFELMALEIPFIQLKVKPFSNRKNYHLNLPYIEDINEIAEKINDSKRFNYALHGKELLINLDKGFDSIKTSIFNLENIFDNAEIS